MARDGFGVPEEWDDLLEASDFLLETLKEHPTYHLLLGMTKRSFHKMAAVYRRQSDDIYIQTGFAQRGLGFGWRLEERGKVELVRRYFRKMPVSLGVAIISCPVEVAQERNRQRELVKETSHENREHMVPLMQSSLQILREEMDARGVPLIEIDSTKPVSEARDDLLDFTAQVAETAPAGSDRQMAAVL